MPTRVSVCVDKGSLVTTFPICPIFVYLLFSVTKVLDTFLKKVIDRIAENLNRKQDERERE